MPDTAALKAKGKETLVKGLVSARNAIARNRERAALEVQEAVGTAITAGTAGAASYWRHSHKDGKDRKRHIDDVDNSALYAGVIYAGVALGGFDDTTNNYLRKAGTGFLAEFMVRKGEEIADARRAEGKL